jgi:hypothetical protein
MRPETISARIAAELRKQAFKDIGLMQAYYPAPGTIAETPAALVTTNTMTNNPTFNEQVWEIIVRVQLVVPSRGRLAAEINSLEPLIIPITDHFWPGSDAFHLRQTGSDQMAHHCQPYFADEAVFINYAGHDYVAIPILFNVKVQRYRGAA